MSIAPSMPVITCRVTDPALELFTSESSFKPNPVTVRFARAMHIEPGSTVFDIGTGIGPLAIKAALDGAAMVYAVDPVGKHCELARLNAAKYGVGGRMTVLQGRYFEPLDADPTLNDLRANVIIGDVSGIADAVSHALDWYSDDVPTGGYDGTDQIRGFLAAAAERLQPGGTVYFPVAVDLSDYQRVLTEAGRFFGEVRNCFDKTYIDFPLSDGEVAAIHLAYEGELPPFIQIQQGRRSFWRGQILAASAPR